MSAWKTVATIQSVTQQSKVHVATRVLKAHTENHIGNSILCLMPKTRPTKPNPNTSFCGKTEGRPRRHRFKSESKILQFLFELKGCNSWRTNIHGRREAHLSRTLLVHGELVRGGRDHMVLIRLHTRHPPAH